MFKTCMLSPASRLIFRGFKQYYLCIFVTKISYPSSGISYVALTDLYLIWRTCDLFSSRPTKPSIMRWWRVKNACMKFTLFSISCVNMYETFLYMQQH